MFLPRLGGTFKQTNKFYFGKRYHIGVRRNHGRKNEGENIQSKHPCHFSGFATISFSSVKTHFYATTYSRTQRTEKLFAQ